MFLDLMKKRQSCRNFDADKQVEREKLDNVLQAGILSPSARNSQPWEFAVCQGKTKDAVCSACQVGGKNGFLTEAPVLIVISQRGEPFVFDAEKPTKSQDFRPIDIGIATHAMCLEATEQGLSTCIIGWLSEKEIQQAIGTTNEIKLVLALGYAKADDPLRDKTRRTLEESVKYFN